MRKEYVFSIVTEEVIEQTNTIFMKMASQQMDKSFERDGIPEGPYKFEVKWIPEGVS